MAKGTSGKRVPAKFLQAIYGYRPAPDDIIGRHWQKLRYRLSEPDEQGRTKTFRCRYKNIHGVLVWRAPDNVGHMLFNAENVKDGAKDHSPIWSTEGEKDACSLIDLGLVAVSHWQAAGNFTKAQARWLAERDRPLHLLYDNDDNDAGAYDLIRRVDLLYAAGVPSGNLTVYRARVGKDVTEHLEAGLKIADLMVVPDLRRLRKRAESAASARASAARGGGASWFYWSPPEMTEPWREPRVVRRADGKRYLDYVVADCSDAPTPYVRKDLR